MNEEIVIPCFDEAGRLDPVRLRALLDLRPAARLRMVDDGSRDATPEILAAMARDTPERICVQTLDRNRGKGEAVRRGLLAAIDRGATVVAYLDADLATPPDEMARILETLASGGHAAVLGSRRARPGATIERNPVRHLLGRAFANAVTRLVALTVYDPQCGAKAFHVSPVLARALETPFHARWAFDVELLARLQQHGVAPHEIVELPLREWRDVAGSRLTSRSMGRAVIDLIQISRLYGGHRGRDASPP